jgi:protein-disulfide isomerase
MAALRRKSLKKSGWKTASILLGTIALACAGSASAQAPAPAAPTPQANAEPFPKVDLKNFTADSPSREEVNSFLTALWGYDPNRIWSVAAILTTPAPGVAKVVVFVGDKTQPGKQNTAVFYTTPDGKHAISDTVIDFGVKPFAANRKLLQDRADGPARGAQSKDLMLVEFADLQCPHCKEVQETMNNLAQDFPQARIVFENFPLTEIHPYAFAAAAEGLCVRKQKGDAAFFIYAQNVFDKQGALTQESAAATLSAAATAAGADPKTAATCAVSQATKDEVNAEVKLGKDLGVDQTPLLAVNGHLLPVASVPYEVLRKIVAFQAGQDGIEVHLQPTLSTLK